MKFVQSMSETAVPRRFARAALFYFVVVGVVGVFLRARYVTPLWPGLQFANLVHAHSHVAYFGWTSLAVMAAMYALLPKVTGRALQGLKLIRWQLLLSHVVNVGALVSFAWGGYNVVSIVFSTVNVLLWYVFMVIYRRNVRDVPKPLPVAVRYWHGAVGLLFLSSIGTWLVSAMTATRGPDILREAGINMFLLNFTDGWLILGIIGAVTAWLSPGVRDAGGEALGRPNGPDRWAAGPLLWIVALTPFTFLTELVVFEPPIGIVLVGLIARYALTVPYIWILVNARRAYRAYRRKAVKGEIDSADVGALGAAHPFAVAGYTFFAVKAAIHFLLGIVAAVPTRHMFIAYLHLDLLGFVSCGLLAMLYVVVLSSETRAADAAFAKRFARPAALVLSIGLVAMVGTLAAVAIIGGSTAPALRAAVQDLLQAAFVFGAVAFVGIVLAAAGLWRAAEPPAAAQEQAQP